MAISRYTTKNGELRYKAVVWDGNHAAASKSFKRKIDAENWHSRQSLQLEDSRVGRPKGRNMTLREFFDVVYWPNKNVRENSAIEYKGIFENHIAPVFGSWLLADCDAREWSNFQIALKAKKLSNARINRIHAVASAIYKMALQWHYVSINPLAAVAWLEVPISDFSYWSFDEVQKFLSWGMTTRAELFGLYHTAYETGMRISELLGLQRDCVDLEKKIITVRRSLQNATGKLVMTTKSGHKRVLGINPTLVNTLQRILRSHNSPFVFCLEDGSPLKQNYVQWRLNRDQGLCGVRRIGVHSIRHTYASHFVTRGGSIYELKTLLGHQSVETTMRYAHLAPEHLQAKAQLVSFSPALAAAVIPIPQANPKPSANHFPTMENEKAPTAIKARESSL